MASEHAQTLAQVEADVDALHVRDSDQKARLEATIARNEALEAENARLIGAQLDPKEVETLGRIRAKVADLKAKP